MLSTLLSTTALLSLLPLITAQEGNPVTGKRGNATVIQSNPLGSRYVATLPEKAFTKLDSNIKGTISAISMPDGIGVKFSISFSNLPTAGGPFLYHLHDKPVPADGNCTATGDHLDPFQRGQLPACDPDLPQTCEVGDLSGKYGKIVSDPFTAMYKDLWATTLSTDAAFFGNRSFVVHNSNGTRITCANFKMVKDGGSKNETSTGGSTRTTAATSTTAAAGPSSSAGQIGPSATPPGPGQQDGNTQPGATTAPGATGAPDFDSGVGAMVPLSMGALAGVVAMLLALL